MSFLKVLRMRSMKTNHVDGLFVRIKRGVSKSHEASESRVWLIGRYRILYLLCLGLNPGSCIEERLLPSLLVFQKKQKSEES